MYVFSSPSTRRSVSMFVVLLALVVSVVVAVQSSVAVASSSNGRDSVVLVDGGRFDVWVDAAVGSGVASTSFGDVSDVPLMGDWNCDGIDTPGVFRAGGVFLRNGLMSGGTDRSYSFGAPGDTPLAGDFDGDGCDSVSVYRPSTGRVYVSNSLSGTLALSYTFGNPGDAAFAGDFDGDGVDTVGLHRVSTGLVYFRNTHTSGIADFSFTFGNPGDRVIAGDWDGNNTDTVAAYRPSNGVLYLKNAHTTGNADSSITVGAYRAATSASGIPTSAVNPPSAPAPAPAPDPRGTYVPDVHVYAGESLASVVASKPQGTVFMIHGTHYRQYVKPKNGQVFVGAPGAVLDGQHTTSYAFSSTASGVVVQGLEIKNYENKKQRGAVDARSGSSSWQVLNNNIHNNYGAGVALDGDSHIIRGNNIHHQHQIGIKVVDSKNTVVENNEIAYNNWLVDFDWGWEAGGTKFWDTDNLVLRNNWSHHNHGPGLWSDHNNYNTLYESNLVEDNYGPGIFHEISYKATIRYNTLQRNGHGHPQWLWGAGVVIAASQDVDIHNNTVTGNGNGISLIQQSRGSGNRGAWIVRNNYVHHNTISGGKSGAVRDNGSNQIFNDNNRFNHNTYTGNHSWAWDGSTTLNWTSWRNTGNDTNSTYTP